MKNMLKKKEKLQNVAKTLETKEQILTANICKTKHTNFKKAHGITLIALVITILFSYDEKIKCSNSKGFLLTTI